MDHGWIEYDDPRALRRLSEREKQHPGTIIQCTGQMDVCMICREPFRRMFRSACLRGMFPATISCRRDETRVWFLTLAPPGTGLIVTRSMGRLEKWLLLATLLLQTGELSAMLL